MQWWFLVEEWSSFQFQNSVSVCELHLRVRLALLLYPTWLAVQWPFANRRWYLQLKGASEKFPGRGGYTNGLSGNSVAFSSRFGIFRASLLQKKEKILNTTFPGSQKSHFQTFLWTDISCGVSDYYKLYILLPRFGPGVVWP